MSQTPIDIQAFVNELLKKCPGVGYKLFPAQTDFSTQPNGEFLVKWHVTTIFIILDEIDVKF